MNTHRAAVIRGGLLAGRMARKLPIPITVSLKGTTILFRRAFYRGLTTRW